MSNFVKIFTQRVKFIELIECEFKHIGYPKDTQRCALKFSSNKIKKVKLLLYDPANICNQVNMTYERNGFHVSSACENQTDGEYQVGTIFVLERDVTKYILQHYLPSAIIVFVSQTSFVVPLTAIPGRISLVVTQFLALTNIFINELVLPSKKI